MTTHHLLDGLGRVGQPVRVLMPGTAYVYAPSATAIAESDPLRPASPYAVAKLAQEQLALRAIAEDGVEVILTRSFNHTGPRQKPDFAAASFARQVALIERGQLAPVIKVGNLEAHRDLTDVRDVARAYASLIEKGRSGDIYNVASGTARPIRAVLEGLIARAHTVVRVEPDPARMRPNDIPVIVGDPARLATVTGWAPTIGFEQMLDDLLTYWRSVVA
jgi:GDP-4-dehydro-6-deoxy-D-mannose reductase